MNFLKDIKFWIGALILSMPSFVSAFLNFYFVSTDFANALSAISISSILVSLWLISNYNKFVQLFLFLITLIPNLFYISHIFIFKVPLYDEGYYPLFQSPLNESINFIRIRYLFTIPTLCSSILLFYFSFKNKPTQLLKGIKIRVILFAISLLPFLYTYFHFLNGNSHYYRGFSADHDFYSSLFEFKHELNKIKELSIGNKLIEKEKINPSYPTIVIIIGESTTSKHFPKFGYYRNTSPKISNRRNLILKEAKAPHAHTIESLTKIFNFKNNQNLISGFNKLGYKSVWLSNQKPYGLFESLITAMSRNCDTSIFINNSLKTFNENYDEVLLPQIKMELSDQTKKVIFIHLMGTHEPYSKRYPVTHTIFKDKPKQTIASNSKSKQDIINQYDNALYYQDSVLNEIFKLIDQTNNTAAFYFSDHGDEVYDKIDIQGHTEGIRSEAMLNVPFMFYANCKKDTTFINQMEYLNLENLNKIIYNSLMIND